MVVPTKEQTEAIESIYDWFHNLGQQTFLLDGGAGTGKSTVAALAIDKLKLKRPVFGAYTARAARVMGEKGMAGASTLHRLLYQPIVVDGRTVWRRLEKRSPCNRANLIIVDEVSMVDETIAGDILSFGKPVLVLGDVDGQLPPIEGRGAFTSRRPDFRLLELHRSAANSPLTQLAWRARRGAALTPQRSVGVRVEPLRADSWDTILDREYQVICGRHKSRMVVTRRARERLGLTGPLPFPGEPLVCLRNSYNFGFLNGDQAVLWRITEIKEDHFIADLLANGEQHNEVPIWRRPFNSHFQPQPAEVIGRPWIAVEFDWAYAITCHKAQGSEWDKVCIIDDLFMRWDKDLRRRWLYTAITRAREEVVVFQTG